jgi:hypothetical protein
MAVLPLGCPPVEQIFRSFRGNTVEERNGWRSGLQRKNSHPPAMWGWHGQAVFA